MSQDDFTPSRPEINPVEFLAEYSRDKLGVLTRCAREYGEVVFLQVEDTAVCLLSNPDAIEEAVKDRLLFVKAEDLRMMKGLLGNGLVTSEGSFWQRQRRLIQPVFHQHRIANYGEVMVKYTQSLLETWRDGETRDIHADMMRLTLNIVMKTIFDQDVTDEAANHIAHAVEVGLNRFEGRLKAEAMGETLPATEEARYQSAIALLDETIYAMINHRRSTGEMGGDLLSMLMQVRDADDGSQMTDQQLRDETTTLVLAGHETTSNTLAFTWMLLAQHPEVQAKLTEELQTVLGGRAPTSADLARLPYANMVIKESLRLYPVVTDLTREATRDCEIAGHSIPAGCTIIMSQWVMHRDPRYFDAPEMFAPERWVDDLEKRLPRGVYFPFGDGPRVCIGKSFALMEVILLLATIAQRFQLDLVPDQTIELQSSITVRPKHGIQVVLKQA